MLKFDSKQLEAVAMAAILNHLKVVYIGDGVLMKKVGINGL